MNKSAWSELDDLAVTTCRALAMDSVQNAGGGHPGTAMALAPVAYTLFQRIMRHDPSAPNWLGRDRFVLSAGHSSLTLYCQLFLSGYGLELEDLQKFRKSGSKTPAHPEFGHTLGVEITTGPLGSGISSAVGMAMASRFESGLLDPKGESRLFNHDIWVIASDGDLQEGISAESCSLAGTQELGNLKVIYDDNRISIEGDTHLACTEDISARYLAYGWRVIEVAAKADGDVDQPALEKALLAAQAEKARPTLIRLETVIAWPAPNAKGTPESHGSALGEAEVAATKLALSLNSEESFVVLPKVLAHARLVKERGAELHAAWNLEFREWEARNVEASQLLKRLKNNALPADWEKSIPTFEAGTDVSTRAASGKIINSIAQVLPELWGGSADLAGSNNTTISGGGSFLPASSKMVGANPHGRVVHFGIREHAMGAIINGVALHGLTKFFGGTFLVFSDYMRGAVRLASLMKIPSIFIWSHDSIGLGEDGPTHQPIEHVASLRLIPNFALIRPADANETAVAWREIITRREPVGLALSRQNLPVFDRTICKSAEGTSKGAYIILDTPSKPDAIIIATGSEVHLAIEAAKILSDRNILARVVSAPCLEWFEAQDPSYRELVLPADIRARVSVEAGVGSGWHKYVGDSGEIVSIENFASSASGPTLFAQFGFTPKNIAEMALRAIDNQNKK
jgi:transketolase